MTIVNDVVTFQASDFADLSDFAVAAIKQQAGGSLTTALSKLSKQVTSAVSGAKAIFVQQTSSDNADVALLLRKFAAADAATLAAAADEIAALSSALGPTPP